LIHRAPSQAGQLTEGLIYRRTDYTELKPEFFDLFSAFTHGQFHAQAKDLTTNQSDYAR
jgi:hypothetical protein